MRIRKLGHLPVLKMISMRKINSLTQINHSFEDFYYRDLFQKFLKDFPKARILNKTIEFYLVYQWFSYYRIEKQEARKILKEWESRGFCKLVQFHGIKISSLIGESHA